MEEKLRRLINWMNKKPEPPFTLDVNPTDKCNLACLSCWKRNPKFKNLNPDEYELDDRTVINYVKEAIKLGVFEFEITGGGEPLMRKDLFLKIARIIKLNGKFGNVTTNGTLFEEKTIKFLVKIGWDRVTFSLDGPNARINDYLRGRGSFEKVLQSISLFLKWKKRMKKNKPILKFNTVISNKNFRFLDKMVILARKCGVELIHFDKLTIHSNLGKKLKLKKSEIPILNEKLKRAHVLAQKFGIWTNAFELTQDKFIEYSNRMVKIIKKHSGNKFISAFCYEPWWHMVVKVDGSVQPCCLYDEKVENIKEKSLREIWVSEYFEGIRKRILNKEFSEYCNICNAGQVLENLRIKNFLANWMDKNARRNR